MKWSVSVANRFSALLLVSSITWGLSGCSDKSSENETLGDPNYKMQFDKEGNPIAPMNPGGGGGGGDKKGGGGKGGGMGKGMGGDGFKKMMSEKKESDAPTKGADETAKEDSAKKAGDKAPMPDKPKTDDEKGSDTKEPDAKKPEDNAKTAAEDGTDKSAAANEVVLGDSTLTAGIPGDGTLTEEQVKAWLASPGVLDPLKIKLPQGLDLAAQQITGVGENPLTRAKIELGRQLYFDKRLSADGTVSCASCHDPAQGFAAHTQFGVGIKGQTGGRNSPVSYNRILSGPQFWDGRAASLEEQAKGPIANPIEMGNTHEAAVKAVAEIPAYKSQFDAVFGADSVNIDNIAKAIASFERVLVTGPAPYDFQSKLEPFLKNYPTPESLEELKADDPDTFAQYEELKKAADAHPMSESAIRGMRMFFMEKTNCTACHAGANFTDEKYHNLGVGMDKADADVGRKAISGDDKETGAFKTPTLRNTELSAPYMHDGSQKTLEEVVEWYAKGGHPNPHLSDKIKKLDLSEQDKKDLVEFMKALTGEFPKVNTERLP